MPNAKNDGLFHLIKSLEKSEKRNFKLYMKRVSGSEDFIIMQLFDAIDKMENYDEAALIRKNSNIKKHQLSNLKAHLTKQVLASLRILNEDNDISVSVTELIHNAHIYYNKGLYIQSLKVLNKAKTIAISYHLSFDLIQILNFEKNIESLHITRSMEHRADMLTREVTETTRHIHLQGVLSNLALNMYSWYIKRGHARNAADVASLEEFFKNNLPVSSETELNFYEKMYYYQAHGWYYFILQHLPMFYRYSQKWFNLFQDEPAMQLAEPDHYLKAFHNLLNAHFDTNNYHKFIEVLNIFEEFSSNKIPRSNINLKVKTFVYLYTARINKHFLEGTFLQGLEMVPEINRKLNRFKLHLDKHRILVFYYKIACLYFGSGDNENAILYLNKIINENYDLRTDLQCYARLLHLIAHFELGNYRLIEYLLKSVYRFMYKMNNLSMVEKEIFFFLKQSFNIPRSNIIAAFGELKEKLEALENDKLETRSFMYLDIKSWLESKIRNVPVEHIRRELYFARKDIKKSAIL